jgi:hypothetical protein
VNIRNLERRNLLSCGWSLGLVAGAAATSRMEDASLERTVRVVIAVDATTVTPKTPKVSQSHLMVSAPV